MNLLSLKWWHWIAIGLVIGLILGSVQCLWGPAYEDSTARTLSQSLFEDAILGKSDEWSQLAIKDLMVHPPDKHGNQWVTGRFVEDRHVVHPPAHYLRLEGAFKYPAQLPYRPKQPTTISGYARVEDFLDAARKQGYAIDYRRAWYEQPWATIGIWATGCLVIIGGVWPLALVLLTGQPLGSTSTATTVALDKRRSADQEQEAIAEAGRKQRDELQAVVEQIQERVAQGISSPAAVADQPKPEQPIGALSGETEQAPVADAQSPDKDYAGEFYPTEVHVPRQEEDSKEQR